jgi:hypothetical protein
MTRQCPECGLTNDDNDWTCQWCGSVIQNEKRVLTLPKIVIENNPFSIESFCRENFHLFTIIGVIGTMLVLLPNLAEKILGVEWIDSDFKLLQIIFAIFTIAGGLLLFTIFFVLVKKIWGENTKDNKITKQGVLLFCILFLMMIGTFYFIFTIVLLIPNYTVNLSTIVVVFILFFAFIIYSYYLFFIDQFHFLESISKQEHGIIKSILYIAILIGLFALIVYFIATPITNIFVHPQDPHDVTILTDQEIYSPLVSERIGIE